MNLEKQLQDLESQLFISVLIAGGLTVSFIRVT